MDPWGEPAPSQNVWPPRLQITEDPGIGLAQRDADSRATPPAASMRSPNETLTMNTLLTIRKWFSTSEFFCKNFCSLPSLYAAASVGGSGGPVLGALVTPVVLIGRAETSGPHWAWLRACVLARSNRPRDRTVACDVTSDQPAAPVHMGGASKFLH